MYRCYCFKRDDNEKLVWVDFETMMTMDGAGYLTLPDGVQARRCRYMEKGETRKAKRQVNAIPPPVVSDTLGFPDHCLKKFTDQLQEHKVTDVWFERDPTEPTFYQVHGASRRALDNYTKKVRGMVNRTGRGAVLLSEQDFADAKELALRGKNV